MVGKIKGDIMKKCSRSSEKGITLVEILASIVLLSIIIVSLLSMFVQSSNTNNISKNIMDATYVAENSMEEINNAVSSHTVTTAENTTDFLRTFSLPSGYKKICPDGTCYEKRTDTDGHYLYVVFQPKDISLVTVQVKVYNNDTSAKKLESQMEMIISWKK